MIWGFLYVVYFSLKKSRKKFDKKKFMINIIAYLENIYFVKIIKMPKKKTTPNPEIIEEADAEYVTNDGEPIERVRDTTSRETTDVLVPTGNFTKDELAIIERSKESIDFSDSKGLIAFWSEVSWSIAEMTGKVLSNKGKLSDLDRMWEELGSVVTSLSVWEAGWEKSGLLPWLKRKAKKSQVKRMTPADAIDKLEGIIDESWEKVDSYIPELEELQGENIQNMRLLAMHVQAWLEAVEEKKQELERMKEEFAADGQIDGYEQMQLNEMQDNIEIFLTRINDLKRTGLQCVMSGEQLSVIKKAATQTKQKMLQLREWAIPVIQMQMAVSMMAKDVDDINKAGKAITDMVQNVVIESAKKTKDLAVSSAEESQRPVLEDRTLEIAINSILEAKADVKKLCEEWRKKIEGWTDKFEAKLLNMRDETGSKRSKR